MSGSLEERLAALEERLGMESGLRASMDQDLASINAKVSAQHHLIQALSITQAEHTAELARIREAVAELLGTVAELLGRVTELRGTVAEIQGTQTDHTARLGQIITLLETLIARGD